ncbi:MAG TPA: hypothetical protein VGF17_22635, partial [Phytomonospora sp.]
MHRVAILAIDRVVALDLVIPAQVFTTAHTPSGEGLYDVAVCGERRGLAVSGIREGGEGDDLFR